MSTTGVAAAAGEVRPGLSLHRLGVWCGLTAGAWLGLAEAPTKLVTAGFSPFIITIGMVAGVFVARWTVPMVLKGTSYVFLDVWEKKHLIVWGLLAGMLWAVANTLTVFAIRDIGLSIAFPLWNVNSLIGLFWGWLLFSELRGSDARQRRLVLGGAIAIVVGACLTARATVAHSTGAPEAAVRGILAALGAALLWGTMYIPYRKAYLSGMNPLSFVTIFTFGELGTTFALGAIYHGGPSGLMADLSLARPVMFWLFLGGLCWVIGDLFQHYAAKYVGIGRGIPLSNTNQLWGLAWGALVFGELASMGLSGQLFIVIGSLVMMLGVLAISRSEATKAEHASNLQAMERECARYDLDRTQVAATLRGEDPLSERAPGRRSWEIVVMVLAVGIFGWLAIGTQRQPLPIDPAWLAGLSVAALVILVLCGVRLWKRTRFS
jgi:drug/metabolite transporter (DMT)-like permease